MAIKLNRNSFDMNPPAAILLTSTPFVAYILQNAVPPGHEQWVFWANYGAFAIMAFAAYNMLKAALKQANQDRLASEERMSKLFDRVLNNEAQMVNALSLNNERMQEVLDVIEKCEGRQ